MPENPPFLAPPSRNRILTASLAADSEDPSGPVSNLAGVDGEPQWVTDGTTSDAVQVDAGAAVTWRVVGLFRTNLTSAASWRVMLGTTAGAFDVHDSGSISAGIVPGIQQAVYDIGSDLSAQHLRIEIADGGNPDSHLAFGLGYAGVPVVMPKSWQFPQALALLNGNPRVASRGGQSARTINWIKRSQGVVFRGVPRTFALGTDGLQDMEIEASGDGNFLWIPEPAGAYIEREAIFGEILSAAPPARNSVNRFSWAFSVLERL